MSNSRDKFEEKYIYWDNHEPFKKINNILTPIQAVNQLNLLSLKYKFDKEDQENLDVLKEWIKSK